MHEHESGSERGTPPATPRLVLRRDDDGSGAPGPVSHAPSRGDARREAPVAPVRDEFVDQIADSLADLFLGEPSKPLGVEARRAEAVRDERGSGLRATNGVASEGASSGREAAPRVFASRDGGDGERPKASHGIELLVVGHLPVLGGAWIAQYAAQVARDGGEAVALARLEDDRVWIDLFGASREDALESGGALRAAITRAGSLASRWLVRAGELSEAALAGDPRIGRITLLSGVSESSLVSAYRTLKTLVRPADADPADGDGVDSATGQECREQELEVRIALLGASPERAREASARIRRAAAAFLRRRVDVVVCADRIGATDARPVFRGPFDGDAAWLVEMIAGGTAGAGEKMDTGRLHATAGGHAGLVEEARVDAPTGATERTSPREAERAMREAIGSTDPQRHAEGEDEWFLASGPPAARRGEPGQYEGGHGRVEGATSSSAAPRGSASALAGGLARGGAALLGYAVLPFSCPDAPGVELAADPAGRLHAVVFDEVSVAAGTDGLSGSPGRVGVAALLSVEAWATANAALIARAVPFLRQGPIGLHLLTRVPAAARDLLATRVKVHLVARAAAPGDVCLGLN